MAIFYLAMNRADEKSGFNRTSLTEIRYYPNKLKWPSLIKSF